MKNRLVVLLSGNGSTLQAIIDRQSSYSYQTVAVISNSPTAYGLTRAERAGIKTAAINHCGFPNREAFDRALLEEIEQHRPDLVVLAGYMRILTPHFVNHFSDRLINIHPSLLPKHKGLNTHSAAIESGDKQHGTSIHYVTKELDSGSVIAQAVLDVTENCTADLLEKRVKKMEQALYPQILDWMVRGRVRRERESIYLDNSPLPSCGFSFYEQQLSLTSGTDNQEADPTAIHSCSRTTN